MNNYMERRRPDAEVEGGLHVSPSVSLLVECSGPGDAHVPQQVVDFGGDSLFAKYSLIHRKQRRCRM